MQSMDTDNSGTITADELREAMKKQGSPLVQEELQRLLESIDVDATGRCLSLQNDTTYHVNRFWKDATAFKRGCWNIS